MSAVAEAIYYILLAFLICLWVRVIMSYFPITPGSGAAGVSRFATAVTEPILRPLRRVLPTMRAGAAAFDLSPIIVSIAVIILMRFV